MNNRQSQTNKSRVVHPTMHTHTHMTHPYPPKKTGMANSALEHIASYSTPGQTQPPQPEEQGKENDETPGQKRKRPAQEAPQLDQATQHGEGRQNTPQPTPSEQHHPPPHVTPSPAGPLPNYSMPQFNRARSQTLQISPTNEAQKR